MNKQVKKFIEDRKLEAAQKDIAGKLRTVVEIFGDPITRQVESTFILPDLWELEQPEMNEMDEDVSISEIGKVYDGLRQGLHFWIKYDMVMDELKASWKGYDVYHEVDGEVECYVPFPEWEDNLNGLCINAIKLKKQRRKPEISEKEKSNFLGKLRKFWGL